MKRSIHSYYEWQARSKPPKKRSAKRNKLIAAYHKAKPLEGEHCRVCGNQATERHHVYETGYSWMIAEPENLEPLCTFCHARVTATGEDKYRDILRELEPERMQRLDYLSTQGKANQARMLGR